MVHKQRLNIRKWRLIVRNVSFACSEDDLTRSFYKYGEILEIVMPKKKGNFAGFCFVQYKTHDQAMKAMKEVNGREIKGRTVAVDWAMPKDQYMTAIIEEKRQNDERSKEQSLSDNEISLRGKSEKSGATVGKRAGDSEADEQGSSSCTSDYDDRDDDAEEVDIKPDRAVGTQQVKKKSEDVQEGRTLFIRGIPFDANENEFKSAFEKFGSLNYALICKFHDSDHSKGSGFVKFVEKSAADSCLEESQRDQGVNIRGRRLTVCRAVSRHEAVRISTKKASEEKEPTDKRNLHLLRVGLIRAGTQEAADMSDKDASKRLKIEASNRRKIKNLHIFVSPTRLVIHNVPTSFTDAQLKRLCQRIVDDKSAIIKECRIMRDLDRTNSKGLGKSRGYAFVEFAEHKNALECVKKLNNNPEVFSDKKRPIVEFSLENRLALNAKALRLEKSKLNLKRPHEKDVPHDLTKKRKMVFKPSVVPVAPGGPKKPFPSHMGPKIRTRPRRKSNKVTQSKPENATRLQKHMNKASRKKPGVK